MRRIATALAIASLAISGSAIARSQDEPITDDEPDAVDVAKTPVTDLNLDKEEIPELLIDAQREPYSLRGLNRCGPLIAEVERFDQMLGPDIDLPQAERDRISAGRLGQTIVGSFIPFRGLIREVSGAKDHERKVRAAIQAGLARRGFLKGVGQSKGCKYPARPATREVVAGFMAERAAAEQARQEAKAKD
jgi:hypothetical protein